MSAAIAARPRGSRPALVADCCKGCGRCIEACARRCIEEGVAIDPATGLVPVVLNLEDCTACGLCFDACPEPYGLRPAPPAPGEPAVGQFAERVEFVSVHGPLSVGLGGSLVWDPAAELAPRL